MARAPRKPRTKAADATTEKMETVMSDAKTAPVKKTRAPSKPRTVFAIVEVLGDDNQPVAFDKSKIKLLGIETNAARVLDLIDGDEHPNAVTLRSVLTPARGAKAE